MTAPMTGTMGQTGSKNPWNSGAAGWGSPQTRKRPSAWGDASTGQNKMNEAGPVGPPIGQPTFAEMQAKGQARPAPPPPVDPGSSDFTATQGYHQAQNLPVMTANLLAPGATWGIPNDAGNGSGTGGGGTQPPPNGGFATPVPIEGPGTSAFSTYAPNVAAPAIGGSLQDAVQKALATGSRYNLPQVQQVRDALVGQQDAEFKAQQTHLDEDMARRGIAASTIGGGYYGDLAGQQARARSGLDASLIQDQATTAAADNAAALGAGQSLYNTQASQGMGAAQLGLQGTLGLGTLSQQGDQFTKNLAQQKDLARMGDVTANRGLDIQGQLANSDLMMRVATLLNSMGYPTGSGSGGAGGGAGGGVVPPGNTNVPAPTPTPPPTPGTGTPPMGGGSGGGGSGGGGSGGSGGETDTGGGMPFGGGEVFTQGNLLNSVQNALGGGASGSGTPKPSTSPYYDPKTNLVSPPSTHSINGVPVSDAEYALVTKYAQAGSSGASADPAYQALMQRIRTAAPNGNTYVSPQQNMQLAANTWARLNNRPVTEWPGWNPEVNGQTAAQKANAATPKIDPVTGLPIP